MDGEEENVCTGSDATLSARNAIQLRKCGMHTDVFRKQDKRLVVHCTIYDSSSPARLANLKSAQTQDDSS